MYRQERRKKGRNRACFRAESCGNPSAEACIGQGDLTSAAKKSNPARIPAGVQGEGRRSSGGPDRREAGACSSRRGPPVRISLSCAEDVGEHGERSTEHAGMQQL
jgi:hypothetical protein